MPQAVAITCQGVSKRFALVDGGNAWRLAFGGGKGIAVHEALREVSFEVPKGEFVGVLGRNGAGKSTLLRVLGGVYASDTGRVAVNGAMSAIYELGLVGNAQLTGRAYAERLLTIHGFAAGERAWMIDDIHDFSELGSRFEDPIQTYSAGMSARLFFATATAGSYDVYLIDEVLSVGDQHFQSKCWRRLLSRVSGGASGVLVTHDWAAIVKMCEIAHVLDNGSIVFSGPAKRAARRYLYGEAAQQNYSAGQARFSSFPASPVIVPAGGDFVQTMGVEILRQGKVMMTCAVERLQAGFGWETSLMTRAPVEIGDRVGHYEIDLRVLSLPLEPGHYQVSLHLATPDPERQGRLILLDGRTWLNGDGLDLEVKGDPAHGLHLPLRWSVSTPVEVPA